jgi:dTDP-4-dehydrorhamnose 3,5-epimerase/acyl carrier protein
VRRVRPLHIEGAWVNEPEIFLDDRGSFHEWFRGRDFRGATGQGLALAQANCSVSGRGSIRGVHYADVPPSQAKYITCVRGAVLDVVVDIRTGSPTYRQWETVRLDDETHRAVFVSEGLGHAFFALTDDATVVPVLSRLRPGPRARHQPARRRTGHPLARRHRTAAVTQGRRGTHSGRSGAAGPAAVVRTVCRVPCKPLAATQEEVVAGLAEIVNEIAGIPVEEVRPDKSFTDDLDVDALSMIEVVVAAEERFDVKIPDDDVRNLKTVGDATDYVLRHQS